MYGGQFYLSKEPSLSYRRQYVYKRENVDADLLSRFELETYLNEGVHLNDVTELWYCKTGMTLQLGLEQIKSDRNIVELSLSGGSENILDVYVVQGYQSSPHNFIDFIHGRRTKPNAQIGSPSGKKQNAQVGSPFGNPRRGTW